MLETGSSQGILNKLNPISTAGAADVITIPTSPTPNFDTGQQVDTILAVAGDPNDWDFWHDTLGEVGASVLRMAAELPDLLGNTVEWTDRNITIGGMFEADDDDTDLASRGAKALNNFADWVDSLADVTYIGEPSAYVPMDFDRALEAARGTSGELGLERAVPMLKFVRDTFPQAASYLGAAFLLWGVPLGLSEFNRILEERMGNKGEGLGAADAAPEDIGMASVGAFLNVFLERFPWMVNLSHAARNKAFGFGRFVALEEITEFGQGAAEEFLTTVDTIKGVDFNNVLKQGLAEMIGALGVVVPSAGYAKSQHGRIHEQYLAKQARQEEIVQGRIDAENQLTKEIKALELQIRDGKKKSQIPEKHDYIKSRRDKIRQKKAAIKALKRARKDEVEARLAEAAALFEPIEAEAETVAEEAPSIAMPEPGPATETKDDRRNIREAWRQQQRDAYERGDRIPIVTEPVADTAEAARLGAQAYTTDVGLAVGAPADTTRLAEIEAARAAAIEEGRRALPRRDITQEEIDSAVQVDLTQSDLEAQRNRVSDAIISEQEVVADVSMEVLPGESIAEAKERIYGDLSRSPDFYIDENGILTTIIDGNPTAVDVNQSDMLAETQEFVLELADEGILQKGPAAGPVEIARAIETRNEAITQQAMDTGAAAKLAEVRDISNRAQANQMAARNRAWNARRRQRTAEREREVEVARQTQLADENARAILFRIANEDAEANITIDEFAQKYTTIENQVGEDYARIYYEELSRLAQVYGKVIKQEDIAARGQRVVEEKGPAISGIGINAETGQIEAVAEEEPTTEIAELERIIAEQESLINTMVGHGITTDAEIPQAYSIPELQQQLEEKAANEEKLNRLKAEIVEEPPGAPIIPEAEARELGAAEQVAELGEATTVAVPEVEVEEAIRPEVPPLREQLVAEEVSAEEVTAEPTILERASAESPFTEEAVAQAIDDAEAKAFTDMEVLVERGISPANRKKFFKAAEDEVRLRNGDEAADAYKATAEYANRRLVAQETQAEILEPPTRQPEPRPIVTEGFEAERTTTERIIDTIVPPAEAKGTVTTAAKKDPVSDGVWSRFKEGYASDRLKKSIADKVSKKQDLSSREEAIRQANSDEINTLLIEIEAKATAAAEVADKKAKPVITGETTPAPPTPEEDKVVKGPPQSTRWRTSDDGNSRTTTLQGKTAEVFKSPADDAYRAVYDGEVLDKLYKTLEEAKNALVLDYGIEPQIQYVKNQQKTVRQKAAEKRDLNKARAAAREPGPLPFIERTVNEQGVPVQIIEEAEEFTLVIEGTPYETYATRRRAENAATKIALGDLSASLRKQIRALTAGKRRLVRGAAAPLRETARGLRETARVAGRIQATEAREIAGTRTEKARLAPQQFINHWPGKGYPSYIGPVPKSDTATARPNVSRRRVGGRWEVVVNYPGAKRLKFNEDFTMFSLKNGEGAQNIVDSIKANAQLFKDALISAYQAGDLRRRQSPVDASRNEVVSGEMNDSFFERWVGVLEEADSPQAAEVSQAWTDKEVATTEEVATEDTFEADQAAEKEDVLLQAEQAKADTAEIRAKERADEEARRTRVTTGKGKKKVESKYTLYDKSPKFIYHVTPTDIVDKLKREGISPSKERGETEYTPGVTDFVHVAGNLTDARVFADFLQSGIGKFGAVWGPGEVGVVSIIKITNDGSPLYLDPNRGESRKDMKWLIRKESISPDDIVSTEKYNPNVPPLQVATDKNGVAIFEGGLDKTIPIAGTHVSSNIESVIDGFEIRYYKDSPVGVSIARIKSEEMSSPTLAEPGGTPGVVSVIVSGQGMDYTDPADRKIIDRLQAESRKKSAAAIARGAVPGTPETMISAIPALLERGIDWVNGWNGIGADSELHVINPSMIEIVGRGELSDKKRKHILEGNIERMLSRGEEVPDDYGKTEAPRTGIRIPKGFKKKYAHLDPDVFYNLASEAEKRGIVDPLEFDNFITSNLRIIETEAKQRAKEQVVTDADLAFELTDWAGADEIAAFNAQAVKDAQANKAKKKADKVNPLAILLETPETLLTNLKKTSLYKVGDLQDLAENIKEITPTFIVAKKRSALVESIMDWHALQNLQEKATAEEIGAAIEKLQDNITKDNFIEDDINGDIKTIRASGRAEIVMPFANPEQVINMFVKELNGIFGVRAVNKMRADSFITFLPNRVAHMAVSGYGVTIPEGTAAFVVSGVDAEGPIAQVSFMHENIAKFFGQESVRGLIMHELGVHYGKRMLEGPEWSNVLSTVKKLWYDGDSDIRAATWIAMLNNYPEYMGLMGGGRLKAGTLKQFNALNKVIEGKHLEDDTRPPTVIPGMDFSPKDPFSVVTPEWSMPNLSLNFEAGRIFWEEVLAEYITANPPSRIRVKPSLWRQIQEAARKFFVRMAELFSPTPGFKGPDITTRDLQDMVAYLVQNVPSQQKYETSLRQEGDSKRVAAKRNQARAKFLEGSMITTPVYHANKNWKYHFPIIDRMELGMHFGSVDAALMMIARQGNIYGDISEVPEGKIRSINEESALYDPWIPDQLKNITNRDLEGIAIRWGKSHLVDKSMDEPRLVFNTDNVRWNPELKEYAFKQENGIEIPLSTLTRKRVDDIYVFEKGSQLKEFYINIKNPLILNSDLTNYSDPTGWLQYANLPDSPLVHLAIAEARSRARQFIWDDTVEKQMTPENFKKFQNFIDKNINSHYDLLDDIAAKTENEQINIFEADAMRGKLLDSFGTRLRNLFQSMGYDSLQVVNFIEASHTIEYIVFNDSNIKSSDSLEYTPEKMSLNLIRSIDDTVKDEKAIMAPGTESTTKALILANAGEGKLRSGLKALQRAIEPLLTVPGYDMLETERMLTKGETWSWENTGRITFDVLNEANPAEKKVIMDYFETRDASTAKLPDRDVEVATRKTVLGGTRKKGAFHSPTEKINIKDKVIEVKGIIENMGEQLVDLGLISADQFAALRGKYLPHLYMSYIFGDNARKTLGYGFKASPLDYTKSRMVFKNWVDEIVHGKIDDPAFLSSRYISMVGRDIGIIKLLNFIATDPGDHGWVLPNQLLEINGMKGTPAYFKNEAEGMEYRADLIEKGGDTSRAQATRDLAKKFRDEVQRHIPESLDVSNYRKVPDSPRYGNVRDMWVLREIYTDMIAPGESFGEMNKAQSLFSDRGWGGAITRVFKYTRVPMNPPTQMRNVISNTVLLDTSGVAFWRIPKRLSQAMNDIVHNGKYSQIAQKYGIESTTFSSQEVGNIDRQFALLKSDEKSMEGMKARAKIFFDDWLDVGGRAYQKSEVLFKVAKIIDMMESKGASESEAAIAGNKAILDYSSVSQGIRWLRKVPFGSPFITFNAKVMFQLARNARDNPVSFIKYIALPFILAEALLAEQDDLDDDDIEKLKGMLPEWAEDQGGMYFLPWKDAHGRWRALNIGYMLPWNSHFEIARNAWKGEFKKAWGATGMMTGPYNAFQGLVNNKDFFTGNEIYNESDAPMQQYKDIMMFISSNMIPPFLTPRNRSGSIVTGGGPVIKLLQAYGVMDGNIDRYGLPRVTVPQAYMSMVGLNTYNFNEFAVREKQRNKVYEVRDIIKRMQSLMRQTRNPRKREEIRVEYLKLAGKKMIEYREWVAMMQGYEKLFGDTKPMGLERKRGGYQFKASQ